MTARSRAAALFPGVAVLRRYERGWWRPDLMAGLTVGAMLIPQSMAYAELAGLPPEYGFYAVLGPLVVYALAGTSRHLGVGPEPGTAILAATGVATIAGGDPMRYAALMAALALVVAGMCLVGAAARLGFIASVLSKPVLVGYITGVGLTLLSSQIAAFTGVAIEADSFFPRLVELFHELRDIDAATVGVGVGTLAVVLGLRKLSPKLPGALIGVAAATILVWALSSGQPLVPVVGTVPEGLPTLGMPDVSLADVGRLLPVAGGIVLVGFTDNVLTARSIAGRHGYSIEPNQELVALGLTNLTSGLSQGFPVSSSASRTVVPASLGSKTQVVSIVAAAVVVATLLFLSGVLAQIPRAALAAVIIAAALAIIDIPGYRSLWQVSRQEALLAVVAAFGVLVFNVLIGVLVAVSLAIIAALGRMARPHDAVLGDYPAVDGWVEVDAYPEAVPEPGLLVYRFDAPLFFLNADRFRTRVEEALEENPGVEEWLVLDFEGVGTLDATALDTLSELLEWLARIRIGLVAVARANDDVVSRLRRADLLEPTGPLRNYATINAAVRAYRQHRRSD